MIRSLERAEAGGHAIGNLASREQVLHGLGGAFHFFNGSRPQFDRDAFKCNPDHLFD
jgi:hypothetical protein